MSSSKCLVWSLFFLLVACGGDSARSDAGDGFDATSNADASSVVPTNLDASRTADGARGDGAGSDARGWMGDAAALSKAAACIEDMRGQCERKAYCGLFGSFEDCYGRYLASCPDVFFAPGSTRTVEGTATCGEAWRQLPCSDVLAGALPACSTPGTRAPGESCIGGAQCTSNACSGSIVACGVCLARVKEGEPCKRGESVCEVGFGCVGDAGVCVRQQRYPGPLPIGAPCTGAECGMNVCVLASDGVSRCAPHPRLGEACDSARTCDSADGAYCDRALQQCVKLPGGGEPCAIDLAGAPRCAEGASCDTRVNPPRCLAFPAPGQACSGDCAGGASCKCEDAACTTSRCLLVRMPGEPCDAAKYEVCAEGVSRCEQGRCELVESQDAFARLCQP